MNLDELSKLMNKPREEIELMFESTDTIEINLNKMKEKQTMKDNIKILVV